MLHLVGSRGNWASGLGLEDSNAGIALPQGSGQEALLQPSLHILPSLLILGHCYERLAVPVLPTCLQAPFLPLVSGQVICWEANLFSVLLWNGPDSAPLPGNHSTCCVLDTTLVARGAHCDWTRPLPSSGGQLAGRTAGVAEISRWWAPGVYLLQSGLQSQTCTW